MAWNCTDGAAQAAVRQRAVRLGSDVFRSVDSQLHADLTAAESTVSLGGRNARLFAFNGRVPGPLFEARAGDEITIRLANVLGEGTNLHFHGLHIPPTGAADNIFLHVESGDVFTYRFTLPNNHPAGLYWMHPHAHGTVARQVSRGLAAPFVIRGEIDTLPEVAAADEHILMLQDFELSATGSIVEPAMSALMHGREGSTITAGGVINPSIPIRQNGLLRLRLVNASVSRFHLLRLEEHPLHLIGVDGGALGSVRTEDEVLLVPGGRVDILIEGTRVEGSFRLLSLPYDRGSTEMMGGMGGMTGGSGTNSSGPQTLATIAYRGRAEKDWTIPSALVRPIGPLPATSLPSRTFQLGQGMGMGSGMSFTINGRVFDRGRIDVAPRLGTIEEWVYVNATTMDHPMHLHTNPFQVIGADGLAEAAWRDVVLVKAGGRARFRVRFDDFTGKTVQHCHILDHEDQGMMATVEMQG
ncbi:MAG: multicopper oxidase family protein [Thermoanaerobaculia bacterium]|jgi:FtsP/CotA-like multicopper oxidase with cupredoxin domain